MPADDSEISSGPTAEACPSSNAAGIPGFTPQLIHLVSSVHRGGWRQYALDICRHFRGKGWDVIAVTRDAKAVDDQFRRAGVTLRHAPLRGIFDPTSAWRLAAILRNAPKDITVVHVHKYRDAFTALLAKRLAKRLDIRVVSTRHSVRPGRRGWIYRRIYQKVNANIFVSRTAFDRFRRKSTRPDSFPIPPGKVHILFNSIAGNFSAPLPEPVRGPITVLYAGAVVEGKGIECAIDALVSLRDLKIRLRIVGSGDPDYLDKLRRRAMTRGVMEAIDWKINSEPSEEDYAETHFGLATSLQREAFGLDSLRFMAMGRAQVCSANGAQHEYLRDGHSAIFVPPGDATALASAMRKLAEDPGLRRNLAAGAFADFSRRLSWETFSTRLEEIYFPDYPSPAKNQNLKHE